jgi:hypothetical protein
VWYIKFANDQRARVTFKDRPVKEKLLKAEVAVCFNIICENHKQTPKYIKREVDGNSKQSCNPRRLAIKYTLTQELKFLYMEKEGTTYSLTA